jgi:hypothetical protein
MFIGTLQPVAPATTALDEIDARQEQVLRQLTELERRLERVLSEYGKAASSAGSAGADLA